MPRHYESWQGKSYFLFSGSIMIGSSPFIFLCTIVLCCAPFGVWVGSVALHWPIWMVVVGSLLCASTLFFLFRCALTDPGILPRCPAPPEGAPLPQPPTHVFNYDGQDLTWCDTCNLFRPPRAKHCRFCDHCVLMFDHHCPWLGSCIGLRNLRFFFAFICSALLFALYLAATAALHIRRDSERLAESAHSHDEWTHFVRKSLTEHPAPMVVGSLAAVLSLSLATLVGYHVWLLSVSETTNENVRGSFVRHVNPYERGCCANWYAMLCAPLPRSQVDFLSQEVRPGELAGMGSSMEEVQRRAKGELPLDTTHPLLLHAYSAHAHVARSPGSSAISSSHGGMHAPLLQHRDSSALVDSPLFADTYADTYQRAEVDGEDDTRRLLPLQTNGSSSLQQGSAVASLESFV